MILSVCISPCIDVTTYIDKQGNCIKEQSVACGGKGVNVAVGIKRLGGDAILSGVMFEKDKELFSDYLKSEGVENSFVLETGSVRKNYKYYDGETLVEKNAMATEISARAAQEVLHNIRTISKNSEVTVLSGSLPKNLSAIFYKEMAEAVDKKAALIVDATGENLLQALQANRTIDLVKPNLQELEQTTNIKICDITSLKTACRVLVNAGARCVLVSLGKDGAIITDGDRYCYAKSEHKAVNSTVGAGDALVAAVTIQLEKSESLESILRASVAAGTAKIRDNLTKIEYEKIYSEICLKEIEK